MARWYVDRFPKLCAYATQLGAGHIAEDVVAHDVLVRWLANLNGRDTDRLPVDSYWFAAVKNRVHDVAAHDRVVQLWLESQPRDEPATWWGPDAMLEAHELARTVNSVLSSLPRSTRLAFDLVKGRGMICEAAAETLGLSTKAVRRRVERAVGLIRREVAHELAPQDDTRGCNRVGKGPTLTV